jgi:hypothetical protein
MTVLSALKAARTAGIKFTIDGDDLVLQAATPPSPTVINLLSRHKTELLAMLAAREYESKENKLSAPWALSETQGLLPEGGPSVERACSTRRGRVEQCGGVFLHFCVECGRFGPFGYNVTLRAGQLGRWYCQDHRPQEQDEVTP